MVKMDENDNKHLERTSVCPKCGVEIPKWQVRCRNCGELLDKDAGKYVPAPGRRGRLWWFALIVGLVGVGAWTLAIVGLFKMSLLIVFVVLIPWASLTLTWKWSSVGGVLLIIASSSPVILDLLRYPEEQSGEFMAAFLWLFLAWPLILVSSALFIVSRRA